MNQGELSRKRFVISTDTGGTFTDLVIEEQASDVRMFKAPTVPSDPAAGVLAAIELAARSYECSSAQLLQETELFVHGTTHAINAIITRRTALTAMLTSAGHPDILTLREGGRADPFDHNTPFPAPYVPRHLTFEIPGRIDWRGSEIAPFDEARVHEVIADLRAAGVEAVAVCLLWSVANPAHELRVGAMLKEMLPGVAVTLSHELNPTIREFRRATSACIDASLKPVMSRYLGGIEERLRGGGYTGPLMVVTSQGAMCSAEEVAQAPIRAINSGPAMAPVAGRYFTQGLSAGRDVIVADTGGTTYDVSLVRKGEVPFTREAWIGKPFSGFMSGFPSVDVKSVGAGGGSVAWVDEGGVLHVGPMSVGADPGPVCYGHQQHSATVTDAALVLGYIDAKYFLGGTIALDEARAREVIEARVARLLGCNVVEAALAILDVATENMVQAIADISVDQGIDPAAAILIGGGGAAGLNSIYIAKRLGCRTLVVPALGAALSASGGLLSEVASEYRAACYLRSDAFSEAASTSVFERLRKQASVFSKSAPKPIKLQFYAEVRYPSQAWELEVPVSSQTLDGEALARLVGDFHAAHMRVYAVNDPGSPVEIVGLSIRASYETRTAPLPQARWLGQGAPLEWRDIGLIGVGRVRARVHRIEQLSVGVCCSGPAIVESPFTSIVVDDVSEFELREDGNLVIHVDGKTATTGNL